MSNLNGGAPLAEEAPEQEVETPVAEEVEVELAPEGEPEAEPEPEIEYEGERHKVPAKVKEAYERMQAETTRKFQEAAKLREEAEQRHRTNLEIDAQKAQFFKGVAEVEQINEALQKYEQVDWAKWELDDPTAADRADRERIRLRLRRDDMVNQLRGKAQQYAEYQAQEQSKAREKAEQEIKTHIKDWSPQRVDAVRKAVMTNYGLDEGTFNSVVLQNSVAARIVHDAFLYRQSLRKAAAPQLKTVTTVQQVKGSSPSTKDPDKMTMAEWTAWMDKQDAAKFKTKQRH